ncbi:Hypothetical protein CINCED_3A025338 [Cinara cedri]|uniref:Uncharacterized protein n=1 Tax=Cinara cedri TaxID=506608 RepID=A0A5E4MT03_9HEMI|nr:Hypothetical protein CINCED_3A025338 [Cinara cedri]
MAYIQILAIVLCACILQDAYAQKPTMKKSPSKRITAVDKPVNSKSLKLGSSNKYPNLTKVQTDFWKAWNYINNKNQYGKMGTRSARNMFEHMVNNESLWAALVKAIQRYNKMTYNEIKANEHVKLSNILGELMTSPIAKEGDIPMFTIAANDMYESLVYIQSETYEAALLKATNVVNSGLVDKFLDKTLQLVMKVDLNPLNMVIYANKLKKLLDLGGMMQLGDLFSSGVLELADAVKEEEPKTPKPKKQTSKRTENPKSKQVNNQNNKNKKKD